MKKLRQADITMGAFIAFAAVVIIVVSVRGGNTAPKLNLANGESNTSPASAPTCESSEMTMTWDDTKVYGREGINASFCGKTLTYRIGEGTAATPPRTMELSDKEYRGMLDLVKEIVIAPSPTPTESSNPMLSISVAVGKTTKKFLVEKSLYTDSIKDISTALSRIVERNENLIR